MIQKCKNYQENGKIVIKGGLSRYGSFTFKSY